MRRYARGWRTWLRGRYELPDQDSGKRGLAGGIFGGKAGPRACFAGGATCGNLSGLCAVCASAASRLERIEPMGARTGERGFRPPAISDDRGEASIVDQPDLPSAPAVVAPGGSPGGSVLADCRRL